MNWKYICTHAHTSHQDLDLDLGAFISVNMDPISTVPCDQISSHIHIISALGAESNIKVYIM